MGDRGHNRHGPKRGELLCHFCGGEWGLHPTQCGLGWGLLLYQVASSSMQPFGHSRHGPKTGGCAPFRGELGPYLTQRSLGRGLPLYKWHLDPSSRLTTVDMGRKLGEGLCPFWGDLGPPSNTKSPEPRPAIIPSGILVHPGVWLQQTWAENWGGLFPFRGGGDGSPSNTMLPGLRPTSIPSGILINPAVWPQ